MSKTPPEPAYTAYNTAAPEELAAALARERLLSAVGREVTAAADVATILDRVLEHMAAVVAFKGGSISLVEDGALAIVAARGTLDAEARAVRLPLGQGIAGWVAAHGRPYRSDDLDAEQDVRPAGRNVGSNRLIRSYLAVPLIAHGYTLGVLQIDSAAPSAFSATDQTLLEAVAAQVANAVERARLQAIIQEQTRTLEAQNEALRVTTVDVAAQNEQLQAQQEELAARAERIEDLMALVATHAAELDATLESLSDGVWIVRRDGSLLVNRAARTMYGLENEGPLAYIDDIGRLMEVTYLDGMLVERDDLPLAHALRGEPVEQREEIVTTRSTGRRVPVSVSSSPIRDQSGAVVGAVSLHRDITRLKEAQRSRDEFLAVVSHELRTPVTSIKGLVQLTSRRLRRDGDVERALEGLERTEDQVNRLAGLVDDVLDVNRIESRRLELRVERFDLLSLVREAVGRLQTTTTIHALRLQAPNESLWVQGDPHRLDQVLDNLLSNAIKYSPDGGAVEVLVRAEAAEIVVTVRDRGIGIPEEDRATLFERFGRASNAAAQGIRGFGLGLFISREIAERHGGRLWLDATGPDGSTFALALPCADNP